MAHPEARLRRELLLRGLGVGLGVGRREAALPAGDALELAHPGPQQLPAQAGLGVRHAVWLLIGLAQFLGALGALSLPALAPAMMEEVGRTAPSDRAILPCCYIAACARPLSLPPLPRATSPLLATD